MTRGVQEPCYLQVFSYLYLLAIYKVAGRFFCHFPHKQAEKFYFIIIEKNINCDILLNVIFCTLYIRKDDKLWQRIDFSVNIR